MKKKIKAFFIPSVLACSILLVNTGNGNLLAIENQDIQNNNLGHTKEKSYIQLSEYFRFKDLKLSNNNETHANLNLMFPLLEGENSVFFGDLHGSLFQSDFQNMSAGVGWRYVTPQKKFIFGLNSYIDYLTTPEGKNFYQFGGGLELIHNKFELRTNLYTNIDDDFHHWQNRPIPTRQLSGFTITNNSLFANFGDIDTSPIVIKQTKLFNEIDYELGWVLNKNITLYGGGIYNWNKNFDESFGTAKLKVKLKTDLNEKTELYSLAELRTNYDNDLSSAKTDFLLSAHMRFALGQEMIKNKIGKHSLIHKKNKTNINFDSKPKAINITNKTIQAYKKNQLNTSLLKLPIFRHAKIDTKQEVSKIVIENSDSIVQTVNGIEADYFINSPSTFDVDLTSIPDDRQNIFVLFNFTNENCEQATINQPINLDGKNLYIIADRSKNTYNISTQFGDYNTYLNAKNPNTKPCSSTVDITSNITITNGDLNITGIGNLSGNITEQDGNLDIDGGNFTDSVFNKNNLRNNTDPFIIFDAENKKFSLKNATLSSALRPNLVQIKNAANIDIENNIFNNSSSNSSTVLELKAPSNKNNLVISKNSFHGSNSSILIRENLDSQIVNSLLSTNRIDGSNYQSNISINTPIKYIEFINSIIPPELNKAEFTIPDTLQNQQNQTIFSSILIADKDLLQNNIIKGSDQISHLFADSANKINFLNSIGNSSQTTPKIIRFIDKNSQNGNQQSINIEQGIINFDNLNIYGGGGTEDASKSMAANYVFNYKVFTNQNDAQNNYLLKNIDLSEQNTATLKPIVNLSNNTTINLGQNINLQGINFNLNNVNSANVFNNTNPTQNTIVNFIANDFNNYNGQGNNSDPTKLANLFNISDNLLSSSNGIGYSLQKNIFNFGSSAKNANFIGYSQRSNDNSFQYDFSPLQTQSNQLQPSLDLKNNIFNLNSTDQNNNNKVIEIIPAIYINNSDPDDINNNKARYISQESANNLFNYLTDASNSNNQINIDLQPVSNNQKSIINNFSRNLLDYLQSNPFTAYFQFNPYVISPVYTLNADGNEALEDPNQDYTKTLDFNTLASLNGQLSITNIPTNNTSNYDDSSSDNGPDNTNNGTYGINNRFNTYEEWSDDNLRSLQRFSDWQTFDKILIQNLNNNDNLSTILSPIIEDNNKNTLILLNNPNTNTSINVNLNNPISKLQQGQYLIGDAYKFWISTPNENKKLFYNDIINQDRSESKVLIETNIKNLGSCVNDLCNDSSSYTTNQIITLDDSTALLGMNFKINVEQRTPLYKRNLPAGTFFPKKANSFISASELAINDQLSPNNKILIQDNIFTLETSDNTNLEQKDYLNVINFYNVYNNNTFNATGREFWYQTYGDGNNLYRYKIYNNQFNLQSSKLNAINVSCPENGNTTPFVTPIKNLFNFNNNNTQNDALSVSTSSITEKTQYALFYNQNFQQNNLINDYGNILPRDQLNKLKKNKQSLLAIENLNNIDINNRFITYPTLGSLFSTSNFSITVNDNTLDGFSQIASVSTNSTLLTENLIQNNNTQAIGLINNIQNISITPSFTSPNLENTSSIPQLALLGTNTINTEASIGAENRSTVNTSNPLTKSFALRFKWNNIDSIFNIVSNNGNNGGTFNTLSDKDGIFNFPDNSIINGLSFRSLEYTTGNSIIGCSSDNLCGGSCECNISINNDFVITSELSVGEKAYIFKFSDDTNSIINKSIINFKGDSTINLSNYDNLIKGNNEAIFNGQSLVKQQANWQMKLNKSSEIKNFEHFIQINQESSNQSNQAIIDKINQAPQNSIIFLNTNLNLDHNSQLDLRNKALVGKSNLRNIQFIGQDLSQKPVIKNFNDAQINLVENNNKIFIDQAIFKINEQSIISGLNFNLNAENINPEKKLSIFSNTSNKNSDKINQAKIINNKFNLNLNGELKLFEDITNTNLRNNTFQGKITENAFFFNYDLQNLNKLQENYLDFNLNNNNAISNTEIIFDTKINNAKELHIPVILDGKEFDLIKFADNSNDIQSNSKNKAIIIAKNNLTIQDQSIDLGQNGNALLGINTNLNEKSDVILKIKPNRYSDQNKLNLNLRIHPKEINILGSSKNNNPSLITGDNYELHNISLELFKNNQEQFILSGKPSKITGNIFTIHSNNQNNQKSFSQEINNVFNMQKQNINESEELNFKNLLYKNNDNEQNLLNIQFKENKLIME